MSCIHRWWPQASSTPDQMVERLQSPRGAMDGIFLRPGPGIQQMGVSKMGPHLWQCKWGNMIINPHDGSMVLLYMVTWCNMDPINIPYPSHVSIYTSTMDPSWDLWINGYPDKNIEPSEIIACWAFLTKCLMDLPKSDGLLALNSNNQSQPITWIKNQWFLISG